jgi:hypothetical protein
MGRRIQGQPAGLARRIITAPKRYKTMGNFVQNDRADETENLNRCC